MSPESCAPVIFLVFNRPGTTKRVLERIRQARPSKLLIVADGPRLDVPEDENRCKRVREILVDRIDWKCEVLRNYADENLGCRRRISTGLTWAFEHVTQAIILEDDCLPHPDFFPYCTRLLEYYANDARIAQISGTNILGTWKATHQSYHFSYYGGIWGWATWRRVWKYFDPEVKIWNNEEARARIADVLASRRQYNNRARAFDKVVNGEIDSWALPWSLIRLSQSLLSVVPSQNLITNIGFGPSATHTNLSGASWAEIPTHGIEFPLQHKKIVAVDREYDRRYFNIALGGSLLLKIREHLKNKWRAVGRRL